MCIIAYVPKDTDIKKETMKACFDNNKDGAGFMYQTEYGVYIRKGFMTFGDFWKEWEKTPMNVDRVAHFRIATAGKISVGCCHPFPIVENYNDMMRSKTFAEIGFAHNGILSLYQPEGRMAADHSDTMQFINMTLYPLRKHLGNIGVQNLLLETGSRFAIMTKEKVTMVGKWEQFEGCHFSNSTYKVSTYTTYASSYGRRNYNKTTYQKMMDLEDIYEIIAFEQLPKEMTKFQFIRNVEDYYLEEGLSLSYDEVAKAEGVMYAAILANADEDLVGLDYVFAGLSARPAATKDLMHKEFRDFIDKLYSQWYKDDNFDDEEYRDWQKSYGVYCG